MRDRSAYFDFGATSPVRKSALDAMMPYFRDMYGNASSPHKLGRASRAAVDDARDRIASCLGVKSREIVFTSGGTESIINEIIGAFAGNRHRGKHIVTSEFEHSATRGILKFLEEEMGAEVTFVGIDGKGHVRLDELKSALRDDTVLVSVMLVNNEVGIIQDLKSVTEMCAPGGILVQSDTVQAFGKTEVDLYGLNVDLACASSHKFGGPKGVGFIYIKEGTYLKPLCQGSHEFGMRAGTENVPGIVGMAVALEEALKELPELKVRLGGYRKRILDCIRDSNSEAVLNGDQEKCIAATMNVQLPGCETEMLVLALDRFGVYASMGSACHSGSAEPSHVLKSMGLSSIDALNSLRVSMGYSTTEDEVDLFCEVFPEAYKQVAGKAQESKK